MGTERIDMQTIKALWRGLPDWLQRAIHTFWQTFASTFVIGLVPIVADLTSFSDTKLALIALATASFASALSAFKAVLVTRLRA